MYIPVPDKHKAALRQIIRNGSDLGRNFYPIMESVTVYYKCAVCHGKHRMTFSLEDSDGMMMVDLVASGQRSPCAPTFRRWLAENNPNFQRRLRLGDYAQLNVASGVVMVVGFFGNIVEEGGVDCLIGQAESYLAGEAGVRFVIESVAWR